MVRRGYEDGVMSSEEKEIRACSLSPPPEHVTRRQPGRRPSSEPNHAGTLVSTFRLQKFKNINFFCLSHHSVYSIFMWQLKLI